MRGGRVGRSSDDRSRARTNSQYTRASPEERDRYLKDIGRSCGTTERWKGRPTHRAAIPANHDNLADMLSDDTHLDPFLNCRRLRQPFSGEADSDGRLRRSHPH
jgi:hypothetical protein